MEKLKSITIKDNEEYLRQISKQVDINDPEIHNNIVVLQDYCMQNDVMAMAAVQLGIPKRIIYVKNTNLELLNKRLTDEVIEATKEERIELRKKDGYKVICENGLYEELKKAMAEKSIMQNKYIGEDYEF